MRDWTLGSTWGKRSERSIQETRSTDDVAGEAVGPETETIQVFC